MHTHDHPENTSLPHPRRVRAPATVPRHVQRAVATGRTDALGSSDLLQLQRLAGNAAAGELVEEAPAVGDVLSSGRGRPLEAGLRAEMEGRLGHDFSDVRVHTDSAAGSSARALGANAYTVGSDVVFQREHYDPSSTEGRTTLAHELTHVVQQRRGPVDGTDTGNGVRVSDPADRFEQEAAATAHAAMSQSSPGVVQRDAEEQEEERDVGD